jgi:AcrR family transcriptional regulator
MVKSETRVRRTQAERREETTSRILDAAVSELCRKGYAGFRFNDVILAAEVSKGAMTHHFPTKESLVIAALKRIYDGSYAHSMKLIEALSPRDDARAVLKALMRDAQDFYLGPNFAISVAMLSLGDHEPDLGRQVAAIARAHRIPIEDAWLDALKRSGLPDEGARGLLYMTQSVYRGMAMRRYMRNDPEYIRFTTDQWRKLALSMIDQHIKPDATKSAVAG